MTLSGKICLVTGANSGLGLAVSKKLASDELENKNGKVFKEKQEWPGQ